MAYIDGFVVAVPDENKAAYIAHAKAIWPFFEKLGAAAMWENWGDDVPEGKQTSFALATQCKEGESVVFSWTVWPDKATRDAAWEHLRNDPELGEKFGTMPFDGARLIYGGFQPVLICGNERQSAWAPRQRKRIAIARGCDRSAIGFARYVL